jgi:hypothetical protein
VHPRLPRCVIFVKFLKSFAALQVGENLFSGTQFQSLGEVNLHAKLALCYLCELQEYFIEHFPGHECESLVVIAYSDGTEIDVFQGNHMHAHTDAYALLSA